MADPQFTAAVGAGQRATPPTRTIADLDAEIERRRLAKRDRLSGGGGAPVGVGQAQIFSPPSSLATPSPHTHLPYAPSTYAYTSSGVSGATQQADVQRLEQQLREERNISATQQQRLLYLERENDIQKTTLTRLAEERGEWEGRAQVLEEEMCDLQNDVLLAKQQLQSASAKLRQLEVDNTAYQEQNASLSARLQELSNGGGGGDSSKDEYILTLQTHYRQLEQHYMDLQAQLHEASVRSEDVGRLYSASQESLAQLRAEASDRELRSDRLAARVLELEGQISATEREWERLSKHEVTTKLPPGTPEPPSERPQSKPAADPRDDPAYRLPTPRDAPLMMSPQPQPHPHPQPQAQAHPQAQPQAQPQPQPQPQPQLQSEQDRASEGLRRRNIGGGGATDNGHGKDSATREVKPSGSQSSRGSPFLRVLGLLLLVTVKFALVLLLVAASLYFLELHESLLRLVPEHVIDASKAALPLPPYNLESIWTTLADLVPSSIPHPLEIPKRIFDLVANMER